MRKLFYKSLAIVAVFATTNTFAQNSVGIGTTTPNGKSILELSSTTQGLLPPRMDSTQMVNIGAGASETGMVVFNTTKNEFYFWNGVTWSTMGGSDSDWFTNGTHMYNGNTGNVGIGINNPQVKLHVHSSTNDSYIQFTNPTTLSSNTDGLSIGVTGTLAYISNNEDNGIAFWTNTTEKMRLTRLGRLGIGTNNPQRLLTVSNATNPIIRMDRSNVGSWDWELSAGGLGFQILGGADGTALNEYVTVDGFGSVGVGTNTPTQKLDVAGTAEIDSLRINNSYAFPTTAGTNGQVMVSDGFGGINWGAAAGDGNGIYGGNGTTPSNTAVTVTDNINFDANTLFIDGVNNRVGIGTNTPSSRLEFAGAMTWDGGQARLQSSTDALLWSRQWFHLLLDANNDQTAARFDIYNNVATSAGAPVVRFQVDGGDSWINSGNVGIGTSTPVSLLNINDPGNSQSALYLHAGTATGTTTTDGLSLYVNAAGAGMYNRETAPLYFGTQGSTDLTISSTGNVGINTTSPSANLHVDGTMRYVDGSQANGRVLTSDANGNASWANPAANLNIYNSNGTLTTARTVTQNAHNLQFLGTGNIGIGTSANASYKMYVRDSDQYTLYLNNTYSGASNKYGIYNLVTRNNTTGIQYGMWNDMDETGTNTGHKYAVHNHMYNSSGYSVRGIDQYLENDGNGSNEGMRNTFAWGTGTGPVFGVRNIFNATYTGTGTKYGYYTIFQDGVGGSTKHGLYTEYQPSVSGTKYGVYVTGENRNYFSGNVGVGTAAPAHRLHVEGGRIRVSGSGDNADLYQTGTRTRLETNNLFEIAPNGGGVAFNIDDGDAVFNVWTTVNGSFTTNDGNILLATSNATQGQLRFEEDAINGTNFAAIQSPDALAANYTLTLPTTDGNANEVLTTNGTGTLSWSNPSSFGDNLGNHTATTTLNMSSQNITGVANLATTAVSSYDKLRVWSSSNYTIGMASAQTLGYLNDYAMTFTMSNTAARGFLWRDASDAASDGAMSLTTDGRLYLKSTAHFNGNVGLGTATPLQKLDVRNGNIILSTSDGIQGQLLFEEDAVNGVNYAAIQSPNALAANYTLTLPTTDGNANQVLTTNGTGILSWTTPTTGDILGVTAGAGLTGGGTSGTVTLNAAAQNGIYVGGDRIKLGGNLTEATTITNPLSTNLEIDLTSTGDFHIRDLGVSKFYANDVGNIFYGGDQYWRDIDAETGTNIAILSDDGNDGRFRIYENGSTSIDLDANTQAVFNEQGLDRNFRVESDLEANMFFVDAGANRVGIGTNLPSYRLDVQETGGAGQLRLRQTATTANTVSDANGYTRLVMDNAGGVGYWLISSHNKLSTEGDWNSNWNVFNSVYGNILTATGQGRVGIGITTPSYKLDVRSADDIYTIYGRNSYATGGRAIYGYSAGTSGTKYGVYGYATSTGTGNYGVYGSSSNNANNNYGVYGYVSGSANNAYGIYGRTATDAQNTYAGFFDGNAKVQHFNNNAWAGFSIRNTSGAADWRFYHRSSDNYLTLYYNNAIRGTFNSASGNYVGVSDIRLKKNIKEVSSVLDDVLKLRVVNYHFKDNKDSDNKTYGFIAQEVKEIFPNVVTGGIEDPEDTDAKYYGLDYTSLGVLSVKAIQEQQTQIEDLKTENADLKSKLDAQQSQIDELRRLIENK